MQPWGGRAPNNHVPEVSENVTLLEAIRIHHVLQPKLAAPIDVLSQLVMAAGPAGHSSTTILPGVQAQADTAFMSMTSWQTSIMALAMNCNAISALPQPLQWLDMATAEDKKDA